MMVYISVHEECLILGNSAEPYEMPFSAPNTHLCLYCFSLSKYPFQVHKGSFKVVSAIDSKSRNSASSDVFS